MDTITGLPVPHTVIEGHKKTADLIYYDGPLLSLFRGEAGDQYLYYWCDSDVLYNRWIVVRVTYKEVGSLLSNRITLRSILEKPADHYLFAVDIDDNIDIANIQLISPRELPKDYFPTNDWALDVAPLIQGRQNAQSKAYRIKLDGDLSLHVVNDQIQSLKNCSQAIAHAIELYESIQTKYSLDVKSNADHLDALRDGLKLFVRMAEIDETEVF